MATNNAFNSKDPVQVALGGTGLATATNDGIVYGNGTSALGVTSAGTNGQVLLGATSAAPAFATLTSSAGTILYTTGANSLNLEASYTQTARPAFNAQLTSTQTNVTGDGTNYAIVCNSKNYDQATNYNTGTGLFTAPATGIYYFNAVITLSNMNAAHLYGAYGFNYNAGGYISWFYGGGYAVTTSGGIATGGSWTLKMNANDTMGIFAVVGGNTKTVSVNGNATFDNATYFAGYQVC